MKCSLKTNIFIDIAMFLAMFLTSFSGIVLRILAPLKHEVGTLGDIAKWFMSLSGKFWMEVHIWSGIVMLVLLVLHLVCHWSTIDGFCKKCVPNKVVRWTIYALLLVHLLIAVIPWIFIV